MPLSGFACFKWNIFKLLQRMNGGKTVAKGWSLTGFFRNITGRSAETDASSKQVETPSEMSSMERETAPSVGHDDVGKISNLKGALLEIWHIWSGDYSPPTLSMITGKSAEELHLDQQEMDRERVRLTVQLEQDAKKRLANVERAAESGQSLNAFCQIYLSKDKMVAWSFIFPPVGPDGKMNGESVGKALAQSGVTTGIDSGAMVAIFQEPLYFKLVPIAIGTPVVEGVNGSIIERFPHALPKEVKLDENGVADYRAANYVQLVEKDAVICDIVLPQPGTAGIRVDGKIVEPKTVRPAHVPAGTNTVVTEDGKQLVAARDGHLELVNGTFHVRALLEVKGDVDYSTGNIDFPGDVHICGDVRENFVVRAAGTIAVDGIVEAAAVEAGGDLIITRGVVGDNRALLRSRGCVRVKYLENCVVYAGKAVFADCIMNSQIFSDDSITVTSGRGSVIGGAMTAANTIKARMIGAQSGRRTELTLGVLPYVQSELQNIIEDLNTLGQEKEQLDKELVYLENRQGLEGSSGKLAKARMRRSVLGIKEQQLIKRREQLTPLEADLSKCRMECDVVYPVTSLTVGSATWTVKQVRRYCKVVFDVKEGELKEIS